MTDTKMRGTLLVGPYKKYHGHAEYDAEAATFYGRVAETKDVITFEGTSPSEVAGAFRESVDDYLEFCKSRGEEPDKPYSGRFVVRVAPTLHHDLVLDAARAGKSLNQHIADVLARSVSSFAGRNVGETASG